MHDHPHVRDTHLLERPLGMFPSLQCQGCTPALPNSPAKRHLADVTDDRHQDGLSISICVQNLGEISVNHLEKADFVHLGYQIGQFPGLGDGLLDTARPGTVGAAQDGQVPYAQQPFHDLVPATSPATSTRGGTRSGLTSM